VLMVPADGNFTTAIQKGDHKAGEVQGQTRQHARLLNLLGVKQLLCGVNKMVSPRCLPFPTSFATCSHSPRGPSPAAPSSFGARRIRARARARGLLIAAAKGRVAG
jgi:hypothetical protein